MGNFGSESEGGLQKNLKSGVFLQKRIPILKRVMDSKSQCKGKGRREGREEILKNNNSMYILESKAKKHLDRVICSAFEMLKSKIFCGSPA